MTETLFELIGRAVADAVFRAKVLADPKAAAEETGYTLTDEQLVALKRAEGQGLAEALEERLRNMAVRTQAIRAPRGTYDSGSGSTRRPGHEAGQRTADGQPRVALVCAPFGSCNRPSLGVSLLRGGLERQGISCDIHYFNLALAGELGTRLCDLIARQVRPELLLGEWLFAPALFGQNPDADSAYVQQVLWGAYPDVFSPAIVRGLLAVRERLPAFVDACIDRVDWSGYDLVGFSTSFEQTCASLALARGIKLRYANLPIAFGGANCFGTLGETLFRLFLFVDFLCTGYGDEVFPALVQAVVDGDATPSIPGILTRGGDAGGSRRPEMIADLDALPYPDYSDYFSQLEAARPPLDFDPHILMEASRGCWWGEKCQCAFCGQNGTELTYRYKSPGRMLDELAYLRDNYGARIDFADNVLHPGCFEAVLGAVAEQAGFELGWEVRANLSREEVSLLARAGAEWIQPGIESLSDAMLRLMRKGTSLADNIQILKWAKEFGIRVVWNFLYGFPGEDPAEYAAMQELVPLLRHLDPPFRHGHVRIDRFSPYWATPAAFGITRLEPARPYRYVFHALAEEDLKDVANYFDAEYPDDSAVHAQGVTRALSEWQSCSGAALDVFPSAEGIRIVDTRVAGAARERRLDGVAAELYLLCDAAQSLHSLLEAPGVKGRAGESEVVGLLDEFLEQGLMIRAGRRYLSLAVVRDHSSQESATA